MAGRHTKGFRLYLLLDALYSLDPRSTLRMAHHVYIVACRDGTLYTGYTTDVERRVAEHNAGTGAKYTRGRAPVALVHVEDFSSQSEALQREYEIKQLTRPQKVRLVEAP